VGSEEARLGANRRQMLFGLKGEWEWRIEWRKGRFASNLDQFACHCMTLESLSSSQTRQAR